MPAGTSPPSPEDLFVRLAPGMEAGGASDAAISDAERALGVALPTAYVTLLKYRNGGRLRLNVYTLKAAPPKDSYARKKYRVSQIAGVGSDSHESLAALLKLARKQWNLPDGMIPFQGEGHWWCCLDYRDCGAAGEPAIVHYDCDDTPREVSVAPSLATLLAGLSRDLQSLTPALIALDPGSPTGDDLSATLEMLGFVRWALPDSAHSSRPPPPAWEWKKYRSFVKGCDCRVELWRNKLYDISQILTRQRSQKHPMLRVSVALDQEDACLAELLQALGPHATLLQRLE